MKLVASSVAPPTRASLPPPQHARTGQLYVSQNPIAGFVHANLVKDFCSRYQPSSLHLFLASLDAVLDNLKSQHGYEQIKTAIVTVAKELENSTESHLILSSDRLTLQLGGKTLSLPLDAKFINNVNNWPTKIGKPTQ
jgi:hypothetical protein